MKAGGLRHELRLFLVALQFFTRVPVPAWVGFEPAWLNASARYFPAVGLCVGAVAAVVVWPALWLFGPLVAALLSTAATVLLTGGFHEDGFADTCDGLGGAVEAQRALQIMKDSRIGAYGAMGLVLALGLKAAALAGLLADAATPWLACSALVFAHTASRAAAVTLIHVLPYAGDTELAKAKPLASRISTASFRLAWAWVAGVALLLVLVWPGGWLGALAGLLPALLIAFVVVLGLTVWCARWFHRRLGGITGDTLGATQQLTELGALLACLAWLRLG